VFDFSNLTVDSIGPPQTPWSGFPEYNFVGGHGDAGTLPVEELNAAITRALKREGRDLATYSLQSGPQGYKPLREYLTTKLKRYTAIECSPDNILLTSGSLQGMDLINSALLNAGDTVIVEESNYGGALSRFRKLGVDMIAIPLDGEGMRIDVLENSLDELDQKGHKPKFIYTIPTVHNPTATILTTQRREQLLELAARYDLAIVEDECYADLVWAGERPPALYAMDSDERVIHIGSFSKTVAPALRVGYVVAPWSVMGQLLSLKSDAGSGALEQMMLAEYCPDHFDNHLSILNDALRKKLDTLVAALDREFGTSITYTYPPGGIFLWVTFPDSVNTSELAIAAGKAGVAINPGTEWSLEAGAEKSMRLCFAHPDHAQLDAGIVELAKVCHKEFGLPEFGANKPRT